MPSKVWGRDPQEAFEQPFEYGIQDQFVREARNLFTQLYELLNSDQHGFSVEDRSRKKAVWLLAMDALDSLRECLEALVRKEHRVASKLFRNVMESMDLAAYFHGASDKSKKSLDEWYDDEIVPHREYRNYIRKHQSPDEAKQLAKRYKSLSRFTHRSYRAILEGYSIGGEDRLVHDRTGELFGSYHNAASLLVLPQTIASYYAILANFTLEYASELSELGLVSHTKIREAFAVSLEPETVQRRFSARRWLMERRPGSTAKREDEE